MCQTENLLHFLNHGTAALFWVKGYIKYPIFENMVMRYSWIQFVYQNSIIYIWLGGAFENTVIKNTPFQEHGNAALFWVNRLKYSSLSWSTTRQCGALLRTTKYHSYCGALSSKNYEYMNKLPGSGGAHTPLPHSPPGKGESGVWARPPTL